MNDVPPSSTAAPAVSVVVAGGLGVADVSWQTDSTAASPASPAQIPKTDTRISATLMPASRAASGLPPTA